MFGQMEKQTYMWQNNYEKKKKKEDYGDEKMGKKAIKAECQDS